MKIRKFIMILTSVVFAFVLSTGLTSNAADTAAEKASVVTKVPVLMYHSVKEKPKNEYEMNTATFERQIKYLAANGYTSLSIDQYYSMINGEMMVPKKPVLITFDDGASDNYTKAFPILKKYKLKATYFVVANWLDTKGYLTSYQVNKLAKNNIDIECHGLNHERLSQFSSDEQYKIVYAAREKISKISGKEVNYYAFPYGDLNLDAMMNLYNMDFKMGLSSISGISSNNDNRYCMKRIYISGYDSFTVFKNKLLTGAE